mgnify:FL=1
MCVFLCFLFVFWVFVAQSFWFLFVFVEVWKIERVGKKLWVKIGGMWWRHRTKKKKKKKTRRWLPLQKHQPETSRKVRFLVFAKEFVRFGFVAERALQTRSRRYTDAFFLISRSRTCRREDFQDEVRAVPRRGTGGRTQTGTFTRVFWTQTNWNG